MTNLMDEAMLSSVRLAMSWVAFITQYPMSAEMKNKITQCQIFM